ncbi:MAG: gamma-butyrobetaine hydroxylase-like domain-containing protein [Aestuariivirga sp.]
MTEDWPVEIRLKDKGATLETSFDSGLTFALGAEFLRVESPSAEVKGHGPGQEQLVSGKRHVRISRLEPVGNYAIRIIFDDGHGSGLYTWSYLRELNAKRDSLWTAYLGRLEAQGRTRG